MTTDATGEVIHPFSTRWTQKYPDLGTDPIPVEPMMSEEYFEAERERIFKKTWLNVGRVEQIPDSGDYFRAQIPVTKTSAIIVRDRSGAIRAHHNICTHRGNELVDAPCGKVRHFRCNFHGWNFGLDGSLRGVPDEDSFPDFPSVDRAADGLIPLRVDTWEGFIFVSLDAQAEPLDTFLGEWGRDMASYPFHEMTTRYRYTTTVDVNWKIAIDAFQEAYHAPFLHKGSGDALTGKKNPFLHALDIQLYERHRRLSVPRNLEHQPTRLEALGGRLGASSMYARGGEAAQQLPRGVNPMRASNWAFDINVVFPNFFVDVSANDYFTYNFWPISRNRTHWDVRLYHRPPANASMWIVQEYSHCRLRDSLLEDMDTLERTQRALESGVKKTMHLQEQEILIRHGHHVIEQAIRGDELTTP